MRSLIRRMLLAIAGLSAIAVMGFSAPAIAQSSYPNQQIRFLVGFPPGGGTDILTRAVAQKLSLALGRAVIVENYAGANGNIASERAAHSPADGYTIMMISVPHAVNASLYRHLPYDPVKDFVPVIYVASVPMVLTVSASSPIKSVADLIAQAKEKPDQLTFSSGGIGSQEQLSGLMFEQISHIKLTHVPYKGSGNSLTDLLGGRITMGFNTMPSILTYINSGNLRPLAVADDHRAALLPNVPTMIEAGVPGFLAAQWYGIVAPTGTPQAVVTRLNTEVGKILQMDDIKALFARLGAQPTGGSPAQFGSFLNAQFAQYRKVVTAFHLTED